MRGDVRAGALSLLAPGLGQVVQGRIRRGLAALAGVLTLLGLGAWQAMAPVYAAAALVWLWAIWDAYRPAGATLPLLVGVLAVYMVGLAATEFRPTRLVTGLPGVRPILRALLRPDLYARPTLDRIGAAPVLVPCVAPLPAPAVPGTQQPALQPSAPCAAVGDTLIVTGTGFLPDFTGELWWLNPIGEAQRLIADGRPQFFHTDPAGTFQVRIRVPLAVPLANQPAPGQTQTHQIQARQHMPYGAPQATQTLRLVVAKMGETIALALLATALATVLAVPLGFLAARNLMGGNPLRVAVYSAVRTMLNIIRSIETLIWAIIFAAWVGLGPFAGMLALLFHSIAALGKLYSETVESIDPGPIEAIRATGANGLQVIRFGVIPQIVPSFLSFTLYRWDINVRMATVIGLVSNAGIGFLVVQWVRLGDYNAMATTIIAIALVVATLDYVSSGLRQRIMAPGSGPERSPIWRYVTRGGLAVLLGLALIWSWRVAAIDLNALVGGAQGGLRLARDLLAPRLIERPTETRTVAATLPVACDNPPPPASTPVGQSRITLSPPCAGIGEPLAILGTGLPPNARVYVRWVLPDGATLRVRENCCTTDAGGQLRLETRVNPLMDPARYGGQPGQIAITWDQAVGGFQASQAVRTTLSLSLVTLLMALIATTLGSLAAIPISFLAARNIVGYGRWGDAVYYTSRGVLNLWRSIEPLILALIFAAWVGLGPFAGVLALMFNNIPNLGKLFSDSIEEIDPGPVEAITSTGANRLQTIAFGVAPQLAPQFLAFILYQWDINLRMSTVIGFVGGGGIGQQWRVWVQLNQYAAAAVATWAIVAMVWAMDYVSARSRQKLT